MSVRPAPKGWRVWLLASRPATLPAAWAPVFAGLGAAIGMGYDVRLVVLIATLLSSTLIQVGTNLSNDVSDFHRGADNRGRLGPPRVTQMGFASPKAVQRAMLIAFGGAAVIGLYLIYEGGWPILTIGIASILAGIAYTGGPWPFGYHGLGDLFVFVFFGLLAVAGTYLLQAERIDNVAVGAGVVLGMTVTAILVANNLRDIETDVLSGKRTLAVMLGKGATRVEFGLLLLLPYVLTSIFAGVGTFAVWTLLLLATLPFALHIVRGVASGWEGQALNLVLKKTAQLHLLNGVLLAIGLAL